MPAASIDTGSGHAPSGGAGNVRTPLTRRPRGTRGGWRKQKQKTLRALRQAGQAGGAPTVPAVNPADPKDLPLLKQAVAGRWPIDPAKKTVYVGALDSALVRANAARDLKSTSSLLNVLVSMEGQNQADEHLEIRRRDAADAPPPAPVVQQTTVLVGGQPAAAQSLQERAAKDPALMRALMEVQERLEAAPAPAGAH